MYFSSLFVSIIINILYFTLLSLHLSIKIKSFFTLGILAVVFYFIGVYTHTFVLRLVTKPIPIIVMLALLKPTNHYSKFIFGGLVLSMVGDILLAYGDLLFVYGLAAFMLAHVVYIIAFFKRSKRLVLVPFILLMAYGIVMYWLLYPGLGTMAHPVLLYIMVILTMSWRAFAQGNYNKNAIYAVAGSILFVLSDSIIAFNKFYVEIQRASYLIMLTYWAAQSLLFYSAYSDQKTEEQSGIS